MQDKRRLSNRRWESFGPYYAMFPLAFATEVIERYTCVGNYVLDPFLGRGSSAYAAATNSRHGVGIEINPVGWLFAKTKLAPPSQKVLISRLNELNSNRNRGRDLISKKSRDFYNLCFSPRVLDFLLTARGSLDWRRSKIDGALMAFILVYLHGKTGGALSNQMRQGKSMSPDYSVRWWNEKGFKPPEIDAIDFLKKRILWRYKWGVPHTTKSISLLGNSTIKLNLLNRWVSNNSLPKFDLLFTSPPYNNVTDYHYDQWLRLWMLGGPDYPTSSGDYDRGKFEGKEAYKVLLENVFIKCAKLMKKKSTIYVRTDARFFTFSTTLITLLKTFPNKQLDLVFRPYSKKTQTSLFGDHEVKPGEVDIILTQHDKE